MKFIYKITILTFLIPLITFGSIDKEKHEKTKIISKEYSVNADAKVAINNKYGDLNITSWNKNRVEIEVQITVKGDDLDEVESKLETIQINFNANSNFVEAETVIEKNRSNWSWWSNSKNVNYKINYIVKMPKTNSVSLNNDYGSIYLGDLDGDASISCDYGKISVGELSSDNNNINLDYCSSSSIKRIKEGSVNIDYSKLTIDNSERIKLNADYSTMKFDKAGSIDFNQDYGSISINDAAQINGNTDYVTMRFGTVRNRLTIDTDYGSLTIKDLKSTFDKVDINAQYTGIRIGVENGINFDFEIDLQYSSFKRNDDNIEFYKSISKSTKKYYEGKYGKGNSKASLKINSQYGSVKIEEN